MIIIMVLAAAGIAYTMATSSPTPIAPEPTLQLSLGKTTVNYGDQETWSVKGLAPGGDYVATIRLGGTAAIIGKGTTDANGTASGSFVVGQNIPPGTFIFRVELASDPAKFDEVSIALTR